MRFLSVALMSILVGTSLSGCGSTLPSAEQLQFYLPENIRKCPNLPSPPKVKSNRATAVYIIKLHAAAKACGSNMGTVDKLYLQYRAKLKALAK